MAQVKTRHRKDAQYVISDDAHEGDLNKFLVGRGLDSQARLDLQDAGLIQHDAMVTLKKGSNSLLNTGRDG